MGLVTKGLSAGVGFLMLWVQPAFAETIESSYTKLDFDKGCRWSTPTSEEEAQMGGDAICDGLDAAYPVFFAEDDLRQFTAYGPADDPMMFANGFAEWNSVHDTIEWRLEAGRPFATIHRWFLDNINPETGAADPARRGQVLVISTVAQPEAANGPLGRKQSCVVGYVDAKANDSANVIARDVADAYARDFVCGTDRPVFHGVRGEYSGTPNDLGG